MSQKNTKFTSSGWIWQRHALAKACVLALAGSGVMVHAQTDPGAALLTTFGTVSSVVPMSGAYWSSGYNTLWENSQTSSGSVMAPINTTTFSSVLSGAGGAYPVAFAGNSILASALGNQAIKTQTTLNRVSASNDGVLSLNLQIFTGLVDTAPTPDVYLTASSVSASLDNSASSLPGTVNISQSGLGSASLSLSNNSMGASVNLNSLETTVVVATPAGYTSTSKGQSALAFDADSSALGDPSSTPKVAGSTGSINLSSQQGVFNATGTAEVTSVLANIRVSEAATALSSGITANSNSISASTTNNAAVSVFRSTADSAAFTGSAGVTNLQSTNIVDVTANQLAKVNDSGVNVDLRDGASGSTSVSGAVTVSNNSVTAFVAGNAAGSQSSSGVMAAGNALIFESSSNITGAGTTRSTDLVANIGATSSTAKADLLINNVQLNSGNTFTSSLDTPAVTTQLDALSAGGSLSQSANNLGSTATNNLAGNLISAGQYSSVGSIAASSVILNTQKNNTVTTLSEVQDAVLTARVGSSASGVITLGNNTVQATAQGNQASNVIALKADQLTVGDSDGSNGVSLTPSTPSAVSGLAVSALNVQTNTDTNLTALNQGGSLAMTITGVTAGTQAGVMGNRMAANVSGNSAANQVTLQSASAPSLNAGVGNLQVNDAGTIVATSGSSTAALAVSLTTGATSASQLTLGNNTISAQAQLNSGANTLSVTNTQSNGVVNLMGSSSSGDLASVNAQADLVLTNAQLTDTASASASSYGQITSTSGTVDTASSLQTTGNQVTALAEGNTAGSTLTLNNGSLSQATAVLVSNQRGTSNTIGSVSEGKVTSTTSGVSGASTVTMTENAIQSAAASNMASNTLSATVVNAVGVTSSVSPELSYSSAASTAAGDLVLSSQQKTDLSAVAARTGSSSGASQVTLTADGMSGSSSLAFNTNTVSSAAYANNVTNAASLNIGASNGMAQGLLSTQEALTGTLIAETYGEAAVAVSSVAGSTVSASTNAISSTAKANTADNSLSFTSTNASGRGTAGSFVLDPLNIAADNAVANVQNAKNNPVSASTAGNVTLTSTGSVSSGSTVSFSDNTVSAYGSTNFANNQMVLAVDNLSKASNAVVSVQSSEQDPAATAVSATTSGSVALTSDLISGSTLAMNGNTIKSTALDNVAGNRLSLTGSTASGTSGLNSMDGVAGTTVNADVSLVNRQVSTNGELTANTGTTTTPVKISTDIAGVNTGATTGGGVTSKGNGISSMVFANNASNTMGLTVTTLSDMTSALSNTQKIDAGALTAVTAGDVTLTSTAAVNAASLTLDNNSITSTAGANESANKLIVNTTDISGRDIANRITNAGTLAVTKDLALGNDQQMVNGSTVAATTTGNVQMNLASNPVGTSNLALSGNSLSANGSANNASNQLSVTATNISLAALGLASQQTMDTSSKVESEVAGNILMTMGSATDANLSATGNNIQSTALGNIAGNTLNVTAATYTGPTTLGAAVVTQAGSAGTSSTADLAIANVQTNTSTLAVSAKTTGKIEMAVGAVELDAATSSNSLTGNSLKALAQSNSASNDLKLSITQFSDAAAGVASYQSSAAAVSATLSPPSGGLFAINSSGNLLGGSITVSGNTASALAGINEAFNSLTASGANVVGRAGSITSPSVGVASSIGADFSVVNEQTAITSANASVDLGTSGFVTTGVMTGGTVSVSTNEVLARASANTASNVLTLSAANRLEASGVVNNVQTMATGASVSAEVLTGSRIAADLASADGGGIVTVKDNAVTAQATGNVANNALNASATSGIATAGATTTSPTFAVLNHQTTGSSSTTTPNITAVINGQILGSSQLGGALNGGAFSASGNQLASVAYGNSANNTVVVSALAPGLSTASASITSVQYNMASVKAEVSGTSVVANGSAGTTGGAISITGNSIVANVVGNRSINAITGR